jgi:hypothetical protein
MSGPQMIGASFARDEGGESAGLSVRVQSNTVGGAWQAFGCA